MMLDRLGLAALILAIWLAVDLLVVLAFPGLLRWIEETLVDGDAE